MSEVRELTNEELDMASGGRGCVLQTPKPPAMIEEIQSTKIFDWVVNPDDKITVIL
jgi:hypothetical protein